MDTESGIIKEKTGRRQAVKLSGRQTGLEYSRKELGYKARN